MPQVPDLALADRIIDMMNEALRLDPAAVTKLVCNRIVCNAELADHPTVQVNPATMEVGMLGFLNGLCGVWGPEGVDGSGHLKNMGPITVGELVREKDSDPIQIARFMRTDILRAKKDGP